jgi:molybdopterin-guanine dinucleotide biosynthesis protein A
MISVAMPFLGETLLDRVINRVAPLADELLVTTNHPERYLEIGVPLFKDILPGRGALGGLFTALSVAKSPIVIVVACDMPFVNPDILIAANEQLEAQSADVAIPLLGQGYEPFHAVYRRETCLNAVQKALEDGKRRLISWFPSVKVSVISEKELLQYDPLQIAFWNVNTKEDLQRAEKIARELNS